MQGDSSRSIESIIQQGYAVKISDYIRQGWELFKQNALGFVLFTLIYAIIASLGRANERLASLGAIVNLVVSGPLTAGYYIVALKLLRERTTTFSDFFRGFNNFLPFFLAYIVTSILIGIGMILLIIPGIYLAIAYMFAVPFIVARKLDFWEAMESSRKLISKNWFSFFAFGLALLAINIVGALFLGVGLLVTIPLSFCAIAAAYVDIVGLPMTSSDLLD